MGETSDYVRDNHVDNQPDYTEKLPSGLILWIVFSWVVAIVAVVLIFAL